MASLNMTGRKASRLMGLKARRLLKIVEGSLLMAFRFLEKNQQKKFGSTKLF